MEGDRIVKELDVYLANSEQTNGKVSICLTLF